MNRKFLVAVIVVTTILIAIGVVFLTSRIQQSRDRAELKRVVKLRVYDRGRCQGIPKAALLDEIASAGMPKGIVRKVFEGEVSACRGIMGWKGSYLGVAELDDGSQMWLWISYYGGYFELLESGTVWQFCGESYRVWDDELRKMFIDVFMPAREKRYLEARERQRAGNP